MRDVLILPTGRGAPRVVALVVAVVLAILGARSILSFAALSANPSVAYALDSGNAEAAAAVADRGFLSAKGPEDAAAVRQTAIAALRLSPYAPQAMRNIGFVDARVKSEAVAEPVLAIAGRTSMRDFLTHLWLFDRYYRGGDLHRSIYEADLVLSQKPDRWSAVFPLLIDLLEDRKTVPQLAQALARRPLWRSGFIERMGLDEGNADGKFALLAALKRAGQPASSAEMRTYFLVSSATTPSTVLHARWLALTTAPALARLTVIDGSFDGADSPPPFAWQYLAGGEVYAESQGREDGRGKALYASFPGRALAPIATQRLALGSGRYRLSGEALAEDDTRDGQFVWTVTCVDSRAEIARLPLRAVDRWTGFGGTFAIPAGCPAQTLTLSGDAVANGGVATMWVDDVAIASGG